MCQANTTASGDAVSPSALQSGRGAEAEGGEWLIVKRDLYYRPNACGYTGIRDNAGRYSYAEAKSHVYPHDEEVTMVRLEDAPEITKACFSDLAIKHLQEKRYELAAENTRLREALKPFATTADQIDQDVPGARSQVTYFQEPQNENEDSEIPFPLPDYAFVLHATRQHDPHPATEVICLQMCHLRAARSALASAVGDRDLVQTTPQDIGSVIEE